MIDKTSVIDKNAKISDKVTIGPFCNIGPEVVIEENVQLHSHVHVTGNTKIGSGTQIFPFASIGTDPQDLKYHGEKNALIIGKNNKIREYVTINPGTKAGGGKTVIGDNCLLMISSHVAHDCIIGNNVVIGSNVTLLPVSIVSGSVIGAGSIVTKSIKKKGIYAGNPAKFLRKI